MNSVTKNFEHLVIQLEAIISATNNFADSNCIGRGGFGKVYKGQLHVPSKGHTTVALKRLDGVLGQGQKEFWNEIMTLSHCQHENIVALLGYCDHSGEKILVYEYIPNKSLDLHLQSNDLSWVQRLKICIGVASGLAYLHNPAGTKQRLLHRDIKSSNILLDENWNPRIADFGLSKRISADQQYTFQFSQVVGTIGYTDPLYLQNGLLTKESDVYSFGVVMFEVLCGRLCFDTNNNFPLLIESVRRGYEQNILPEIVHASIKDEINPDAFHKFTTIAYRCLNFDREQRPSMNEIVISLQSALSYQVSPSLMIVSNQFPRINDLPPRPSRNLFNISGELWSGYIRIES